LGSFWDAENTGAPPPEEEGGHTVTRKRGSVGPSAVVRMMVCLSRLFSHPSPVPF